MAITFLQAKKRQRYLLLVSVLVIIATLIIVWQGFLKREEAPLSPIIPALTPQKVLIDWPTLKDPEIETFKSFEPILPFEGEIGRENPFIPY